MLQRIQTLFLLISSVAMLLASTLPLARFHDGLVVFQAMGVYLNGELVDSTWALMVIGAITTIVALITIFLYKGRVLQIRLTILNTLFIVGFYIFAGLLFWGIMTSPQFAQFESVNSVTMGIAAILPLVAIVMNIMAIRKIYADEALVRSLSRLR